jgi:D-glycero-alpha-D-manno-heptose-7-phosphate kinase
VYYEQHGATIVSFAINRYIYVTHNDRPTGGCRLSYSEVEELPTLAEAKHTLVRAVARRRFPEPETAGIARDDAGNLYPYFPDIRIPEPCTLTIVSDLPKGTGLGSSSALTVALCTLAGAIYPSVASMAYHIERQVSPVGCQDHLPATYGGFNIYRIDRNGTVTCQPAPLAWEEMVNTYGLLLYTGQSRDANPILHTWRDERQAEYLVQIQALADYVADAASDLSVYEMTDLLRETWALKASIAGVSSMTLNQQYDAALAAGALAGKLLGAGGGGCWFFLVSPRKREAVKEALGLIEVPFQVSRRGVEQWTL